jgi:hypothetical protein
MQLSASAIFTCFITSVLSVPAAQPFAIVTRDDNTTSWVGGSAGCFGTYGRIKSVSVTPGYKATFFSDYACKGQVLIQGSGQATFQQPIDTKSIYLVPI